MTSSSWQIWNDLLTTIELDQDRTAALLHPSGETSRGGDGSADDPYWTLRPVPPALDGMLPPLSQMPPVPVEFAPRVRALAQRAAELQIAVQATLDRMRAAVVFAQPAVAGDGPHFLDVAG
ncbi:hypothetical protein [Jatrophihabitans fulvus]